MKTAIIYDSVFGNTEQIARAIGAAFPPAAAAGVFRVGDAGKEQLSGVALLVVGSPTRAFRPTPAIQKFLSGLPRKSLDGVKVAAFDTGIALEDIDVKILRVMVPIFGYAAKKIADGLVKKGGELVLAPEGFFVKGSEGPLKDGELKRAADWAKKIYQTGQGK
jgi:flavodoxin